VIEKSLLGVVLIIVLVAIVRSVHRSIAANADGSKPAACAGCPFDSKCEMQDKPHVNACGGDESE
jgi:hypothetical protein